MFKKNILAINKLYPKIADTIIKYKEKIDDNKDYHLSDVYIEESIDAKKIVAINFENRAWFLNSQYEPEKAAKVWAENYKDSHFRAVFMILGLANGMYVRELLRMLPKDASVLIYEPNEAIFLKVMQEIDISDILSDKRVVVSSGDINKGLIIEFVQQRIEYANIDYVQVVSLPNYAVLYNESATFLIEAFKTRVTGLVMTRNSEIKFAEEFGKNIIFALKDIVEEHIINQIKSEFDKLDLSDIPAIIVAAGPSLDKNIHELKNAKGKSFIIVVDTALKSLLKAGIMPDVIITLDSHKPIDLVERPESSLVPIVISKYSNFVALKNHKGKKFYIGEKNDFIEFLVNKLTKQEVYCLETGGSVANNAFSLARYLGFKKIVLVGQDLAYTNGIGYAYEAYENAEGIRNFIEKEGTALVEDINGKMIKTAPNMLDYKKWFENQILKYPELEVIDATEGGAKIIGTTIQSLNKTIKEYPGIKVDFAEIINSVEKIFDEENYEKAKSIIGGIPEKFDEVLEKLKEFKKIYYQIEEMNNKKVTSKVQLESYFNKIKKANNFIETDPYISLAAIYNRKESYDLMKNIYKTENKGSELKQISKHGVAMINSYIQAINKFKEEFISAI